MTRTISVAADVFRRILPHVSTDRPTLSGVLFEASGAVVATDGHTLAAVPNAVEGLDADIIVKFSEPRKLTPQKVERVALTFTDDARNVAVTMFDAYDRTIGASFGEVIEGPYPSWRHIFSTLGERRPVEVMGIDPEKLARFTEYVVGKKHRAPAVTLDFRGPDRAAVVRWDDSEAVGVIMPCRINGLPTGAPAWLAPADAPATLAAA
jgi:DNA polymerase III sliding clamp (beta) subunit (PCNA family)